MMASGMPTIIQSMKPMLMPRCASAPTVMALGGEPMTVPMPPMEAAAGMPSKSARAKLLLLLV